MRPRSFHFHRPRLPEAVSTGLDRLLTLTPLESLAHRWMKFRLRVLAYHDVPDPASFARQLDYLLETASPITLDHLTAAVGGQEKLPNDAILITFDDGDRSVVDAALPLLRERGLEAVLFVVAGFLDTKRPFWWEEVEAAADRALVRQLKQVEDRHRRQVLQDLRDSSRYPKIHRAHIRKDELKDLEAAGLAIGNHSLTHPCLPRCDDSTLHWEISESHRILTEALGHPPRAFADPNGDRDNRITEVLKSLCYEMGFLFDHRSSPSPPLDPLAISRLRVDTSLSMDRFRCILSGLHPALHRLLGGS